MSQAYSFHPEVRHHRIYNAKLYTHTVLWVSGLLPPNNLFGTAGMSVQLCWQHVRPSYAGDLDTSFRSVIAHRYRLNMSMSFICRLKLCRGERSFYFSKPRLLRRYRALLPRSSLGLSADWCEVLPLLTVYDVIIEDTLEAVRGLRQVLTLMVSMTPDVGVHQSKSNRFQIDGMANMRHDDQDLQD